MARPDGLCSGRKSRTQVRVSIHLGSEAALTGSLVMVTRVTAAPTASSLEAGEPSWLSSAYLDGVVPNRVRACAQRGRARRVGRRVRARKLESAGFDGYS